MVSEQNSGKGSDACNYAACGTDELFNWRSKKGHMRESREC
jgi:hypothetical protein